MIVGPYTNSLISVKKAGNSRCSGQMDPCGKEVLRTSASTLEDQQDAVQAQAQVRDCGQDEKRQHMVATGRMNRHKLLSCIQGRCW